MNFLIQNLALINRGGAGEAKVPEGVLTGKSDEEFSEFISDCVFMITNGGYKNPF